MNDKVKILIGELKDVVLDLHRSAGRLDDVIQSIENEMEAISIEKYLENYIMAQAQYREDPKKIYGYENLDNKEKLIWQKLINLLKTES